VATGDFQSIQVMLALLAAGYPRTGDAATTPEVPMPVSGSSKDRSGFAVEGDRRFFFGLRTNAAAEQFFTASRDLSVV
jgi:hypothetical protein